MANKLVIQNKINSKSVKLEKGQARLAKLQDKLAKDTGGYYHDSLQYDIKSLTRQLEQLKSELDILQKQLDAELEKNNKRDIKVLIDFLEDWKQRVRERYSEGIKDFFDAKDYADKEWEKGNKEPKHQFQQDYYARTEWNEKTKKRKVVKPGKWDDFLPYINSKNYDEAIQRLEADIETDANNKYDTIVNKAEKKGGRILDASHLYIGNNGELNGYLTCENRNVEVRTVGAGGHNIQCFHFRTLIL